MALYCRLRRLCQQDMVWPVMLAFMKLLTTLPFLANSDYQRDELMFIACGRHLAWGYVDDPPLTAWLAALSYNIFGNSVFGLRLLPTLAGALTIVLVGCLVKVMGGRWFSQALAGLGILAAPCFLVSCINTAVFSYEPVFYLIVFIGLAHLLKGEKPSWWLVVGLGMGLGLLTKFTMLLVMAAIGLTWLLGNRRQLLSPYPYLAALIASLFLLPSILWWWQHEWCGLTFLLSVAGSDVSAPLFMLGQVLYANWWFLPLWLGGLAAYLWWKELRTYRAFAIIYLLLLVTYLATSSPIRYLSSMHPILLAGGAIWAQWLLTLDKWRKLVQIWLVAVAITTPIIWAGTYNWPVKASEELFAAVIGTKFIDSNPQASRRVVENYSSSGQWEKRVQAISRAYLDLPPLERSRCVFFSEDGALTSAVDLWAGKYPLPPTACSVYTPYYWGCGHQAPGWVITAHLKDKYSEFFEQHFTKISANNYALPPVYDLDMPKYQVIIWKSRDYSLAEHWYELRMMHR